MSKTRPLTRFALAVIALAAAAAIPMTVSSRTAQAREIRLVVRNMAYYVDGSSEPNPTLTVRRGEQVRVVVRSADAGMAHDFGVDDWRLRTALVDGKSNTSAAIHFRAPDRPGDAVYTCTPHALMMRGTIRVE